MQAWQWWPVHQLGHAHRDPLFNACHAQNAVPADIGGAALLQRLPDRAAVHDAGLAVLADMLITTHFMTLVMLTIWRLPLILVVAFYFVFTPIEATYWSSTLEKVPTGAPPSLPAHRFHGAHNSGDGILYISTAPRSDVSIQGAGAAARQHSPVVIVLGCLHLSPTRAFNADSPAPAQSKGNVAQAAGSPS